MTGTIPRWKTLIENALAKHKSQIVIQVATLDSGRPDGVLIPRVRTQIFRSFLSSPDVSSLPVLITSTDVRTPKVTQLTGTSSKSEIAWWINGEGTNQQFRIIADVYIVPDPKNPNLSVFEELRKKAIEVGANGLSSLKDEDWEKRRQDLYKSMSEQMRASWCRPTPGAKLEGGPDEAKKWPTKVVEPDEKGMEKEEYEHAKKLWEEGLGNFACMIVDPIEVDFVDVGVVPNVRSIFRKKVTGSEKNVVWEEESVVP